MKIQCTPQTQVDNSTTNLHLDSLTIISKHMATQLNNQDDAPTGTVPTSADNANIPSKQPKQENVTIVTQLYT